MNSSARTKDLNGKMKREFILDKDDNLGHLWLYFP
jgi:hypothetical protein